MKLRTWLGLAGFLGIAALCWFGPWVNPYDPSAQDVEKLLESPSWSHWLGTDSLGRDLLARLMDGGRLSISVGVVTGLVVLLLGSFVGALAALFPGWVDRALMRIADFGLMMPSLLTATLITLLVGRGFWALVIAISVTAWAPAAKFARVAFKRALSQGFIEGARAAGVSEPRLVLTHLWPHLQGPLLVNAFYQVPQSILTESFLSFLGLGVQAPQASWGSLAHEGYRAVQTYPHLLLVPGMAIGLLMFSLLMALNGLQERE